MSNGSTRVDKRSLQCRTSSISLQLDRLYPVHRQEWWSHERFTKLFLRMDWILLAMLGRNWYALAIKGAYTNHINRDAASFNVSTRQASERNACLPMTFVMVVHISRRPSPRFGRKVKTPWSASTGALLGQFLHENHPSEVCYPRGSNASLSPPSSSVSVVLQGWRDEGDISIGMGNFNSSLPSHLSSFRE